MGHLYLISTPIGNLEDITYRAVRLLKECDLVLAEDTRMTQKLFAHYGIDRPLRSHHQNNEHATAARWAERLAEGEETIAYVTDAGTPGISDPGFMLVRECVKAGVALETLPGPTAFIPALVNSGLPCDRFCFEGFLPHKKGRTKRLKLLAEEERTLVLYESPYRLLKTLDQLAEHFGEDRQASISRELTKLHEETVRGSLRDLSNYFIEAKVKGEFVLIIAGKRF